jgi:hypothetical protein
LESQIRGIRQNIQQLSADNSSRYPDAGLPLPKAFDATSDGNLFLPKGAKGNAPDMPTRFEWDKMSPAAQKDFQKKYPLMAAEVVKDNLDTTGMSKSEKAAFDAANLPKNGDNPSVKEAAAALPKAAIPISEAQTKYDASAATLIKLKADYEPPKITGSSHGIAPEMRAFQKKFDEAQALHQKNRDQLVASRIRQAGSDKQRQKEFAKSLKAGESNWQPVGQ